MEQIISQEIGNTFYQGQWIASSVIYIQRNIVQKLQILFSLEAEPFNDSVDVEIVRLIAGAGILTEGKYSISGPCL